MRERYEAHFDSRVARPILLIDEAQEMHPSVPSELRIPSRFDSRLILTVVLGLAGDGRLVDKLRPEERRVALLDRRGRRPLRPHFAAPSVLGAPSRPGCLKEGISA